MRKCNLCGRSLENDGTDPTKQHLVCKNAKCLGSVWHQDTRCPICGQPPGEITDGGCGFTAFLCENGHRFTTTPKIPARTP